MGIFYNKSNSKDPDIDITKQSNEVLLAIWQTCETGRLLGDGHLDKVYDIKAIEAELESRSCVLTKINLTGETSRRSYSKQEILNIPNSVMKNITTPEELLNILNS